MKNITESDIHVNIDGSLEIKASDPLFEGGSISSSRLNINQAELTPENIIADLAKKLGYKHTEKISYKITVYHPERKF